MNHTLMSRFTRVESAFAFLNKLSQNHRQAQRAHYERLWARTKRAMALSLVTTLVIVTNWTHLITQASTNEQSQLLEASSSQQQIFDSAVRLDKESYILLVVEESTFAIKPGKSLAQIQSEAARARQLARQAGYTASPTVVAISTQEAHRLAQEAASKAGIPEYWKELVAIWQVESGKKVYSCVISRADGRAVGPLQFMPGTFRSYQADGDGDGKADICNAKDALVSAANLLKSGGIAEGKVDQAIHRYNHSMAYVYKVKKVADSID